MEDCSNSGEVKLKNFTTFSELGGLNWITLNSAGVGGLDNIPNKGGALIIYYHGEYWLYSAYWRCKGVTKFSLTKFSL